MAQWLRQALTRVAHALERALFGQSQSNYRAHAPTVREGSGITNPTVAKSILADVRRTLSAKFQIELQWPILLELKTPPPAGWRATFYNPDGNLARHTLIDLRGNPAHQVLLRPELERPRFRALLAHELVHAYQREANFLNENRSLREGMARWVEFYFLDGKGEAQRLLGLKHYTFGKSIQTILHYESQHGRQATLKWLRALP